MGTLPAMRQEVQCGCCGGALPHALDRRRFMRLAGAGLALTLPASLVLAAEGGEKGKDGGVQDVLSVYEIE